MELAIVTTFLRSLADGLENRTITNEDLIQVEEFFMSFMFKKALKQLEYKPEETSPKASSSNCDINKHDNSSKKEDFSDKEFLKFLTLGWYIYTQLLDTEN